MSRILTRIIWKSKLYFRKKKIYTQKEKNIIDLVRKLASNKKSIIIDSDKGYLIKNDTYHIDCLINGNFVIVTNTKTTSEKQYSDEIIKKLNSFCNNRVTKDTSIIVDNMLQRENIMMRNIIDLIK